MMKLLPAAKYWAIFVEIHVTHKCLVSNPLSPIATLPLETLLAGRVSNFLPTKPKHVNPPIPLFKIPHSEWPQVARRVAQGESLRQIARSYHTSYEAVRRVLNAARKEQLSRQGESVALPPEDAEKSSKE